MAMTSQTGRVRHISLIFIACFVAVVSVHAQTFVAPGDTGSIEYPLNNSSISDAALEDAELQYAAPAHFIVKSASIRGPHSIPPAETYSFVVEYEIAAGAPEGSFNVTLKPRSPSTSDETVTVAPDLATLDTQVIASIAGPYFSDGREKLIFPDFAAKAHPRPGLYDIHNRKTHALSVTVAWPYPTDLPSHLAPGATS